MVRWSRERKDCSIAFKTGNVGMAFLTMNKNCRLIRPRITSKVSISFYPFIQKPHQNSFFFFPALTAYGIPGPEIESEPQLQPTTQLQQHCAVAETTLDP